MKPHTIPAALVATALAALAAPHDPSDAVKNLDLHEGLEATLFASEPMMRSPSSIDVDHRGRIWVCEVVNYRRNNGRRPEGDRILILEDTNGDNVADKSTVF
ncbi:MAG: dehydrogenase, partial [Roseibacillus sp.]|nr:dehydrogenase [Roseibacillus sp.]